ncbi:MAG: hypothetical protein RL259_319 [Bacteroidota bacterium]|jgi:uncharacterized protein YggE
MKKIAVALLLFVAVAQAQETKQVPQITVTGEGKLKVTPDEALITLAVENNGKDALEVKKKNDAQIDKVIKVIKRFGIPTADFQTQQVSLYKNYDVASKKQSYVAHQTLTIYLKNLSKYDALLLEVMEAGINSIQSVEFKASQLTAYESQVRKSAMVAAKQKAMDFVSELPGQKVGKALVVSDSSFTQFPRAVFSEMKTYAMTADGNDAPKETLAIGSLEISVSVTVTFALE